MILDGELSLVEVLDGDLRLIEELDGEAGDFQQISSVPAYEGPYEFEPASEAQTINIAGLKATENIIIDPIPENYGRISWNGSTLTVS